MTEMIDKDFWEKEYKKLWDLFNELQVLVNRHKLPISFEMEFEEECKTLGSFFLSKMYLLFSPEERGQLESKVRNLGYDPERRVCSWFRSRLSKKKRDLYETRKRTLSKREQRKKVR